MKSPVPSSGALGRPGVSRRRTLAGLRGLLAGPGRGPGVDWLGRAVGGLLLAGTGVVLGVSYVAPHKRVIPVIFAAIVFGIAWRLDLVSAIGVLVLALPFPRGMVFGSTNVALVLFLLVIWLLRVSTRQAAPPTRTPADVPVLAMLGSFVISFYNVENATTLALAFEHFLRLVAGMAMFFLIVNNLRRPEHLERMHGYQCVSIAMVCLLALFELRFPDGLLIPGWIEFHHGVSESINVHNVRVGGAFFDFELLSEYCALNLLLLLLMAIRARSTARRVVFGSLLVVTFFILFATVTRGGIMALVAGLVYLGWVLRRRLRFVHLALALTGLVVAFWGMNYSVATFTHSGDLFARLADPGSWRFEGGMPASRAELWRSAFERMMQHPIIGHGPVYVTDKGLDFWYWPHNGYLYVGNLVGFVGLTCYLWLLYRLWRLSRPVVDDLRDPNYARAYLVIGHVQLLVFLVDQMKIDFLRNPIYPFQIWLMFASLVAAYQISRASPDAPVPAGR